MKWKLAAHQEDALFMMDTNPHLGLFFDMGTGKTAIALTWILRHIRHGDIHRTLVVCPASLVTNWEDSIEKMINFEGITRDDVELLRKSVKIVSFQKTYKITRTPVTHRNGVVTKKKSIALRPDVDREWGAVIVDESHGIGNHSSVQTKACLTLARLTHYRYILTATPVHGGKGKEDFSKLYGQMKFLEPNIWKTWTEFCNRYVTSMDQWHNPRSYDVPACRALMMNHAIVCRLEDCFDMPGKTETVINCPLAEKKVYKDLKTGNLEPYEIDIVNAGGQYLKMLQVCSGSMKREQGNLTFKTSKDDALTDILNGTDGKVVIFCNYTASVDRCAAICNKNGRKTVVFDGRSKKPTWKEFQYGDADALVCQYQSGGAGLDLYASNTLVLWEPTMSALTLEQSTGRIYRKGQDKHCTFDYLYTPGTIEKRVWDTVRSGKDVSNDMLAKWSQGDDL